MKEHSLAPDEGAGAGLHTIAEGDQPPLARWTFSPGGARLQVGKILSPGGPGQGALTDSPDARALIRPAAG